MSYLGAGILVAGFLLFMKVLGLVSKSIKVIRIARCAVSDLQNPDLDDDDKEVMMQTHAKQLFVLFAFITLGSAVALAIPAGFLVLGETMGIFSLDDSLAALVSWEFLAPSTLATIAVIGMSLKS